MWIEHKELEENLKDLMRNKKSDWETKLTDEIKTGDVLVAGRGEEVGVAGQRCRNGLRI